MNRSGKTRSPRILAIVPAHNEGPRIGAVVGMLVQQGLPVLVVDDGSSDDTAAAARAAGARVLSLRPNRGKGAALKAGFRVALGRQLADDPGLQTPRLTAGRLTAGRHGGGPRARRGPRPGTRSSPSTATGSTTPRRRRPS